MNHLGLGVSREGLFVKPAIIQCLENAKRAEAEKKKEEAQMKVQGPGLVPCPLALPAPPPSSSEDDDPDAKLFADTYEHAIKMKAISRDVGYGLVAKQCIPAGSIVFADRVAYIRSDKFGKDWETSTAVNELVAEKVKAMGEGWHRSFLALPNYAPPGGNKYAQIWKRYEMAAVRKRTKIKVVGLNLAITNHSCMPNAFLYYTMRYPKDQNGDEDKTKPPIIGRAVVRAIKDIEEGDEITVSYFYAKGDCGVRQLMATMYSRFWCSCSCCSDPVPEIEEALEKCYQLDTIFENADIIYKRPAVAYKAAYELIKVFEKLKINDPRVVQVWLFCAMIAGFNLDLGRAWQFIKKARNLVLKIQGPNGQLYDRVSSWWQTISLMPGFGATTRGLSALTQGDNMPRDEECFLDVLFMLKAKPDEYIRLHRYRRIPDCQVKEGESKFAIRFDAEDMERKRFEDEEPETIEVRPWWIPGGIKEADEKKVERKKRGKVGKKKKVAEKKKTVKKVKQPRNPDCIEPEKDFMDVCRELLRKFVAEDRKKRKQKGKGMKPQSSKGEKHRGKKKDAKKGSKRDSKVDVKVGSNMDAMADVRVDATMDDGYYELEIHLPSFSTLRETMERVQPAMQSVPEGSATNASRSPSPMSDDFISIELF